MSMSMAPSDEQFGASESWSDWAWDAVEASPAGGLTYLLGVTDESPGEVYADLGGQAAAYAGESVGEVGTQVVSQGAAGFGAGVVDATVDESRRSLAGPAAVVVGLGTAVWSLWSGQRPEVAAVKGVGGALAGGIGGAIVDRVRGG